MGHTCAEIPKKFSSLNYGGPLKFFFSTKLAYNTMWVDSLEKMNAAILATFNSNECPIICQFLVKGSNTGSRA